MSNKIQINSKEASEGCKEKIPGEIEERETVTSTSNGETMSTNQLLWEKILRNMKWDRFFKFVKLENGDERKNGEVWMPCPFHGEDTASFSVSKEKGTYYCFGCQERGNLITLISSQREMDNDEAFEKVLSLAGMSDYEISMQDLREMLKRLQLPKFKRKVEDIEPNDLPATSRLDENAFEYLKKRHISRATAIEYNIRRCKTGYYKDYIIIPICDENGRVVTFEARYVGTEKKKKVLYPKDSPDKLCIFNLEKAKKYDSVVDVEGIMDCLSMVSRDMENTITMFGVSMSSHQRELIKNNFEEVILFLDPDEAGRIGSSKLKEDLAALVSVKVAKSYVKKDVKYLTTSDIRDALSQASAYELKKALWPLRRRLATMKGVLV